MSVDEPIGDAESLGDDDDVVYGEILRRRRVALRVLADGCSPELPLG